MISKLYGRDDYGLLLMVSCVGCIAFVIIPWIANLIIATNIKTFVSGNNAAVSYFEHNTALFVPLVVFSGSCYPSLSLVSSRLYGLDMFNSGLTKHELRHLSKIKIFGSILLEVLFNILFNYFRFNSCFFL